MYFLYNIFTNNVPFEFQILFSSPVLKASSNEYNIFGPIHNKYSKLTTSVVVFLIRIITRNIICLNLNSISAHNIESKYLEQKLLKCLDKSQQENVEIKNNS